MTEPGKQPSSCLSCGRNEEEMPLVVLQYTGKKIHICPHCLPLLIHHTERLAEKISLA